MEKKFIELRVVLLTDEDRIQKQAEMLKELFNRNPNRKVVNEQLMPALANGAECVTYINTLIGNGDDIFSIRVVKEDFADDPAELELVPEVDSETGGTND